MHLRNSMSLNLWNRIFPKQNEVVLLLIGLVFSSCIAKQESRVDIDGLFGSASSAFSSCSTLTDEDSVFICDGSLASKKKTTVTYKMAEESTCTWINLNTATGELTGLPRNSDVGDCDVVINATYGAITQTNKSTITVKNKTSSLYLSDVSLMENSSMTILHTDAEVSASDEGDGVYSIDYIASSSPRCSDHGILNIDEQNGQIEYTPTTDYEGVCYVNVQFDDQNKENNIVHSEFEVTVIGINELPTISQSCSTTLVEDTAYSCTPSVSDLDTDDTHTWSFSSGSTCSTWASVNSSTGVISGTPDDDDVGTCTINLKANDGSADSNISTFSIAISNVQPTLTIGDATLPENSGATTIRSDADIQASDEGFGVYSFDHSTTTAPKCSDNGSLSIHAYNGSVTYTPSTDYEGTCNIKVVFDDQNTINNTVSDEFQVVVTHVNEGPEITKTCSSQSTCGGDLLGSIDNITAAVELFSSNDIANRMTCFLPNASGGYDIFVASSASFPRVPTTGHTSISLGDDQDTSLALSFPVTFYGVDYSTLYIASNGWISLASYGNDLSESLAEFQTRKKIAYAWDDLNPNDGGTISWFEDANSTIVTFDGVPEYGSSGAKETDGQIEFIHSTGEIIITTGAMAISDGGYGISNGGGSSTNFDFNGGVTTSISGAVTDEDVAYSCTPMAVDPEGDTITWSFAPSNTCSWMSLNSTTGELTGTPHDDLVGTCNVGLIASDGSIDSPVSDTVITVNNVTPLLSITDTSVAEDSSLVEIRSDADVQASDEGYGVYSLLSDATVEKCSDHGIVQIDSSTGAISYDPADDFDGDCHIKVQFDDQNASGNIVVDEFVVTVINTNDNPVLSHSCDLTHPESTTYSCTPDLDDPDSTDSHTYSLTASHTCSWMTINSSTGELSGTPNDDQVGTCTVAFKTNDGTVDSNEINFDVEVINAIPVLTIGDASVYQDTTGVEIRSDADVQSNNEGYGVYSLLNSTALAPKCSDNGTLGIDSATGAITFTPTPGYTGDCNVRVQFDDQNPTDNIVEADFVVTVMDNVGAHVTKVDSSGGDLTYYYGETVPIDVYFNENVFVDTTSGTPNLKLETGTIDRYAYYASGSGTNVLTFNYIVGFSDISSDLDVHAVNSSIVLSGGTITDNFNNSTDLTLKTGVDPNSLTTLRDIIIDAEIDFAQFSGQPTRVSAAIILDIDVFGTNVTHYKYKIELSSTVDCSDETGYSSEVAESVNITDDISGFINGSNLTLCLLGKNNNNVWQPLDMVTTYVWTKDKYAISEMDISGVSNIPSFKDAAVAPSNDNVIYAQNLSGEILRTTDGGATWTEMCSLPTSIANNRSSMIQVAASDDYTAYVAVNGDVYRVDQLVNGYCINITSSLADLYTHYFISGLTLHPSQSEIFVWVEGTSGARLYKSIDRGENWSQLVYHTAHNGDVGTLAIDPSNDQNMVAYRNNGNDEKYGFYYSIDGGTSWVYDSYESPNTTSFARGLVWNANDTNYVYMKEIYANSTTYYSSNKGVRYSTTGSLPYQKRWVLDGSNQLYYLNKSGFDTLLYRRSSFTNPSSYTTTLVNTFLNHRGSESYSESVSVSNSGSTLAVISEHSLFISTDAGVTFNEINWQGSKFANLDSITSEDGGQVVYGITPSWSVLKSVDGGQNWAYQTSYHLRCDKSPRIRVSPVSSDNVFVWADDNPSTTGCSDIMYSNDGFTTSTFSSNGSSANDVQVAMSPVDNERFYIIGDNSKYRISRDGAASWVENNSLWSTSSSFTPDSYSHPEISDLVWVGEISGSGVLWEYDSVNNTRTNVTSRLGLSSFAGMNMVKLNGGEQRFRAISKMGDLAYSTDGGVTFASEGMAMPLSSCNSRFLSTHVKDVNLLASACQNSDMVSFSRNGGSSWIEMDLSAQYSLNCDIRGIAIHLSKIMISCASGPALYLNYTPLELIADAYDGVLSTTEVTNSNDLIINVNAAGFTTILYAVIPESTVCNQDVTNFSPVIPKSNDANMTVDGNYRVCAKMTDSLGVDFYETSSIFTRDTVVPSFTSIDLLSEASDNVLKYFESYKNINPLVGNLIAAGYDTAAYALVNDATTCDNSLTYGQSIPAHNDSFLTSAGNYKVCVKLTDYAGHAAAFGSSSTFSYSPTYVYASISNTPTRLTKDFTLNVSVSGTNVTKYKYKLGLYASTSCSDSADYSSEVAVGTPITDAIDTFGVNSLIKLCVLGSNATDDWQPYQFAAESKFTYSTVVADYVKTTGANLPNWHDVAISPTDSSVIYAKTTFGSIFKSTDGGSNWELQCKIEPDTILNFDNQSYLFVSQGGDNTAYMTDYSDLYRIDRLHGKACPNLTSGFASLYNYNYYSRSATTDFSGNLYFWETKSGIGANLWKSTNKGERFDLVSVHTGTSDPYARMAFDPNDSNTMIVLRGYTASGYGVYKSTDGGLTFTKKYTTQTARDNMITYVPGSSSYIYASGGLNSSDGGETWSSSSSNYFPSSSRFELDGIVGYRFSGSTPVSLQRTADITVSTPVWTTLKTSPYGSVTDFGKAISVNGTRLATVLDSRLYISNDTGSSWTEVQGLEDEHMITGFDSFNDGQELYAALPGFRVLKTSDYANTWNYQGGMLNQYIPSSDKEYLKVRITPNAPSNVALFTFDYMNSTNFSYGAYSKDSFANFQTEYFASNYNAYGFSHAHDDVFYSMRISSSGATPYLGKYDTSGLSYSSNTIINFSSINSSELIHNAIISEGNKDILYVFTTTKGMYRFFRNHGAYDDISSRVTSLPNFSGVEQFLDADGKYKIKVITATGIMYVSADEGLNWSLLGAASPGLPSCTKRLVKTSILNPSTMVSYCHDSNLFNVTYDSGATWQNFNLSTYNVSCDIGEIAIAGSELFIGCTEDYALRFQLNPLDFESNLADLTLNSTEYAAGLPLFTLNNAPLFYNTVRYAVVSSGTTCDAGLTYSSSIPLSNDVAIVGDGSYKVCIEMTDLAANVSYNGTRDFILDTVAPTFTSIDLAGPVADGTLVYYEHLDDYRNYVDNLVGSNFDFADYALVSSGVTCDGSVTYTRNIPAGSSDISSSGTYKVCVKLTDRAGNTPAYGTSSNFTYNDSHILASIAGVPELVTNVSALNVEVGGLGVTQYRFKIGSSLNCADDTGYSAYTPISTFITSSLSGYTNGTSLTICVLGSDGAGVEQSLLLATEYKFLKDSYLLEYYNFNGLSYEIGWVDVEVASGDSSIIYAKDFNGMIFKSTDSGSSWEKLCSVNATTSVSNQIKVSSDGSVAYTNDDTYVYYIYKNFGGSCKLLRPDWSTVNGANYDIYPNGDLLLLDVYYTNSSYRYFFYKYTEGTANVETILTIDSGANSASLNPGYISIDPNDGQNILWNNPYNSSWGYMGLNRSSDGGASWTYVGTADTSAIIFDPANDGYVYKDSSHRYSSDDGDNWITGTDLFTSGEPVEIDTSGKGYRLRTSGSDTILQTTADLITPSWSTVYTFTGIVPAFKTISAAGSVISLVLDTELYISTDSGVSFAMVSHTDDRLRVSSIDRSGSILYGVTPKSEILKSTNLGVSWTSLDFGIATENAPFLLRVNKVDSNFATLYPPNGNGDYDTTLIFSRDGFSTVDVTSQRRNSYWAPVAVSMNDTDYIYSFGNYVNNYSTDGGLNFSTTAAPFSNVWSSTYRPVISPYDNNLVLIAGGGSFTEYDVSGNTNTSVTSRLTFGDPAGATVFNDGGTWKTRVISRSGYMNISSDGGQTFTDEGSSATMSSCYSRIIKTLEGDPDTILTGCRGSSSLGYSTNGGSTWKSISITSGLLPISTSCSLTDIEVITSGSDTIGIVTCSNLKAMKLVF